ncbi:hypothetical protein [Candidatus Hakubella thermalkaliphila]|uniref:hypothetical protein n=1 Tax=Candidatus Hakubella thermalkaliphila TaxID=2754717 RepID=UPI001594AC88|nr:hypothetical protein [Candidatus Hakubella thermalkaliphila]
MADVDEVQEGLFGPGDVGPAVKTVAPEKTPGDLVVLKGGTIEVKGVGQLYRDQRNGKYGLTENAFFGQGVFERNIARVAQYHRHLFDRRWSERIGIPLPHQTSEYPSGQPAG